MDQMTAMSQRKKKRRSKNLVTCNTLAATIAHDFCFTWDNLLEMALASTFAARPAQS